MTDQHRSHDPFSPLDSDDPLSMMGVAMVGMALEEMAEQEQREASPDPAPSQPAFQGRDSKDHPATTMLIVGIIAAVAIMLLCGLLASTSGF